jgi:hypothetical protein
LKPEAWPPGTHYLSYAMHEALGPEAEHVTFVDVSSAYTRPARTRSDIEGVWQTHPEVVDGKTWSTSDHYEDPDDLLRRIIPETSGSPGS